MKTVFVSEYLCSGAWPEDELPASLVTEGRSMLEALCEDLLACDYKVCTTRDRRGTLSHLSGLEITDVDSPTQEWEAFGELAKQCDATLVIAPELDEILTQRIEWLEQNKLNHFMSSVDSTQTGSDKLLFSQFCLKHNLPTPETFLLHEPSAQQTKFPCPFPFVIKPQFGAGTTMTAVINSLEDWQDFSARRVSEADFPPYIIQPIVCGNFVSTACIISPDGKQTDWLPVGQQLFEDLQYQGGNIPYHHALNDQLCEIAEKVISNLPGLRGYIGLDFLLATDSEHPIQILEINPRLTTSYLGYRMLTKDSLARRLVEASPKPPLEWITQSVHFNPHGKVTFST